MVNVKPESSTVNITVSSSGTSGSVNVTPDYAQYYSEKSREWAISNRIVDNVDYSSKYYAGKANESALNAQNSAQSAQDSYNNFQDSVDGALSTVDDTVQTAIATIDTKSDEAIENIGIEANKQIDNIERTGFYMRDDKLYFINSVGEEEEFKTNDNELNNPFSLLDYKYSEYELNNLSWLRSNGQYNPKAVYPAVYDLLLKIYNGTETKAGVSVKLSTEVYTDYDFVLNTAKETFRLPIKVKLASGKAVVGNGLALGLTDNINTGYLINPNASYENAHRPSSGTQPTAGATTNYSAGSWLTQNAYIGITEDPTKSGIETSDSGLYLYFYVGETVQNANLINAGRIEEQLVDKVDLSNTQWATNACMPDYTAGVNRVAGTYTENVDGVLMAYINSAGISGESRWDVTIAGTKYCFYQNYSGADYAHSTNGFFPIPKNTEYVLDKANSCLVKFFPLKGAN